MLQRKNQAHGLVSNLALTVIVMVVFLVQFFSLSSGPNYYPILLPRLLLATWNIDHTTLRQLLFLLSWSVTQSSPVPPYVPTWMLSPEVSVKGLRYASPLV